MSHTIDTYIFTQMNFHYIHFYEYFISQIKQLETEEKKIVDFVFLVNLFKRVNFIKEKSEGVLSNEHSFIFLEHLNFFVQN